jgi:hypothetical protein
VQTTAKQFQSEIEALFAMLLMEMFYGEMCLKIKILVFLAALFYIAAIF